MSNIGDYSEKLDLLEKTRDIDSRHKKRDDDLNAIMQKENDQDKAKTTLFGQKKNTYESILQQEENNRKMLVHEMNENVTDNLRPVVKVLNHISGSMGKMRKNHENTHEIVRENHGELLSIKTEVTDLRSDMADVKLQVSKATFKTLMCGGVDLSEFFPVERPQQLLDFMDKTHPQWEERKNEFYCFLFNCITNSKKAFCKGLLKTIFTRKYMITAKWPTFK